MLKSELRGFGQAAATAIFVTVSQMACVVGHRPVAAYSQQPGDPQAIAQNGAQNGAQDAAQQAADPADAQGTDDAKVEDFYEPLAAYGSWVDTPEWGRVWQPSEDMTGGDSFVPYASDGSWATNDDGDWVFESRNDAEWGWATYHYGRWGEHADYGWVWVPGTTWAPSWVEWRYGGGYVGWVPAAPPGVVYSDASWFFVEEHHMTSPALIGVRLGPDRAVMAYGAAPPIMIARVGGRGTMGPPVASIRARGVVVRTTRVATARPPARGYARATARTVTRAASARPRPVAKPRVVKTTKAAVHHATPAHAAPAHAAPAHAHATPVQPAPVHKAAPPPAPAKKAPPPPAKKSSSKKK